MARSRKVLKLSTADRTHLEEILWKGKLSARELKRAEILLKSSQGYSSSEIAVMVDRHYNTVRNVVKRYLKEGLESALKERPRPGAPRKIHEREEAVITSLACSEPPEGRSRWTLELLTNHVVQLTDLTELHHETIRRVLKKVNSNRGRASSGVSESSMGSI